MTAQTYDIHIVRGKTFAEAFLYAEDKRVYKDVTALPTTVPARVTVVAHGVPVNWPVRVESVLAPTQLNTPEGEWWLPEVVDADTLEFNDLNLRRAKAFSGPGVLYYQQPADLTGWTARMQVRDRVGGTVLLSFSSDVTDTRDGTIVVDVANSAFVVTLTADKTTALAWSKGVYDLEATRPDGTVVSIVAPSAVTVGAEVTVWV